MPTRNTVKIYAENTYYHIYNRGVEGRKIFQDDQDYKVLLSFLKRYLSSDAKIKGFSPKPHDEVQPRQRIRWRIDVSEKIMLSAYCLMPNHFHLLVKQIKPNGITIFMRSLMNSYVRYFNLKHKRVGGLFQSIFKAIAVDEESYFLHLTRYIHLNPLELRDMSLDKLEDYYSSYGEYIGKRRTSWIYPDEILSYFGSKRNPNLSDFSSYKSFVRNYSGNTIELLGDLVLE